MKLYSLRKILLPEDVEIPPRAVFEATTGLADQLVGMGAARAATAAEIKAATEKAAAASGAARQSTKDGDGKLIAAGIAPNMPKAEA